MAMTTNKKPNRVSRKSSGRSLKHIVVSLDDATVRMALKLGDGELSLGIRRAVVLACIRQSKHGSSLLAKNG
jgi:hypothetical protein